jgi:hypothetical protein
MDLLGADSLSFPSGFRIERVRLNPAVEDMAGCEELKTSRCFSFLTDSLDSYIDTKVNK